MRDRESIWRQEILKTKSEMSSQIKSEKAKRIPWEESEIILVEE